MAWNGIAGDPATGCVTLRGVHVLGRLEQWPHHICIRAAMARSAFPAVIPAALNPDRSTGAGPLV